MQQDLLEYITVGIINFLDRQPQELSSLASEEVVQMAILREFVEGHMAEMSTIEVVAIQMHDGRFELLCLDVPLVPGMRPDRIGALDRAQLAESVAVLLPNVALDDGLRRALAGTIVVDHDCWLEAKRLASYSCRVIPH